MSIPSTVYNLLFRRSSTFALTVVVGAVVFERGFDQIANGIFGSLNRGKLWSHIKHNYEEKDE